MTWGLLLVNLGTPDSTDTADVRRYLDEFLMDPRVIDLAPAARWALVKLAILPFRPAKSAHAYKAIWTEAGSPLRVYGDALAAAVQAALGDECVVRLAMRYGNPKIDRALDELKAAGVDRVVVFPLFPQYSSAATGSAMEAVWREAGRRWNTPALVNVPAFATHPAFIAASAAVARPVLAELAPDRVMMSFHGVPERHVIKSDERGPGAHCLASASCCDALCDANRNCYRAQCFATARALTAALDLDPAQVEVAFQSRLGRDPWISPYTDVRVTELARGGSRRLAVLCPAFTADCLETLEEIGIRAAEDFVAAGGERLVLVPSLNAHPAWVDAVAAIALDSCPPSWRRGGQAPVVQERIAE
ncbi:MAG: ferrochelatase [Myxococcales bacterium]|nr:ferrochelatase [Myxococcales bacterium]MCB9531276.1 ferrochelatase [Myxococcales bacterium]